MQDSIKNYMKRLRLKTESKNKDSKIPVKWEVRKGFVSGIYTDRLVIFLRGSGCKHVQTNGGCTFCGFYSATNSGKKISKTDYIKQLQYTLDKSNAIHEKFKIICLYNDGSMLEESEISFDTLLSMRNILSSLQINKLVIESKIKDITESKIKVLSDVDIKIEIAFGIESSNHLIRKLCINKNFTNTILKKKVEILEKYNILSTGLIMLKPPFLNDKEAIFDALNTIMHAEELGIHKIDIELPTVEKNTLTYELWKLKLYDTLKLWSVIEFLKLKEKKNIRIPIYISPMKYTVPSIDISRNCGKCDSRIRILFEEYNKIQTTDIFDSFYCSCKKDWENSWDGQFADINNLLVRIERYMTILSYRELNPPESHRHHTEK